MEKNRGEIFAKTLKISSLLEAIGNTKIDLVEEVLGRELSVEEREDLYFSAIKDNLYLVFEHCPEIDPLTLSGALQSEEMNGQKHIYFTIKDNRLNRDPTEKEIIDHYTEKRASRFRERFDAMLKPSFQKTLSAPIDA